MPTSPRPKSGAAPTWEMVSTAYDAAVLAQSCLTQLAALFDAIQALRERSLAVRELASIGNYLADDWAGLLEAQCEDLKQAMEERS
jgi:hypothetical protein